MAPGKSDADELIAKHADLIALPHGPACRAGASEHRVLIEALCDRGLNAAAVHRVLKAEGIVIGPHIIQRHHRGDCACLR